MSAAVEYERGKRRGPGDLDQPLRTKWNIYTMSNQALNLY